ncbi:MAG: thiol-disulfide isomerase/thioredoxin, partial [Sphingobacteriales bacterium]
MKRFLSLIAVVAFAATAFGQGQRLVLLEHFTQASCGPCATYNPAVEELFNENNRETQKIIAVKYQTSWPGTDPMYTHNPQDPNARVSYYGVSGVPNSVIDGNHYNGHPGSWDQSDIDIRYAIAAQVDIAMDHEFLADDTIMVTITIDPVVQTVASDLVAHINVV